MLSKISSRLPKLIFRFGPATLVIALVSVLFGLHVKLALQYPYFNQFSNVEDWAYTNIAARNFLNYGFLHTLFLQDYAASLYPHDHPFIYNHMPPGPDVLTALFLLLTGNDYHWTRILFGAMVLPGLYYYVRFARLLLEPLKLSGVSLVLLIAGPYVILNHLETEVHSAFLFLAFAPMVWGIESARDGKRYKLWVAVILTFVLAIYIQYILLAAALFAWIYLYLLKLAPLSRKHVQTMVGAIAVGVLLHLLQNSIYLGPELFFRELLYTIGNRVLGYPTQEGLREFYMAASLVHHGAQPPNLKLFLFTIIGNLEFRFAPFVLGLLVLALVTTLIQSFLIRMFRETGGVPDDLQNDRDNTIRELLIIFRLFVWAGLVVISVILLFPAHTQEVNLVSYGGINVLLFAVPSVALLFVAIRKMRLLLLSRESVIRFSQHEVGGLILSVVTICITTSLALASLGALKVTFDGMRVAVIAFGRLNVSVTSTVGIMIFASLLLLAASQFIRGIPTDAHDGSPTSSDNMGSATGSRLLPSRAHYHFIAGLLWACIAFIGIVTTVNVFSRAYVEIKDIIGRAQGKNDLLPLLDLSRYKGKLFMTNINVPSVGFFSESPGYGVCGRDAVSLVGKLDTATCKVAQMRRQQFWRTQHPDYFFYFKQGRVFPGFATCWPRDAYLGIERGGAGCNEELGERLHANFQLVDSNELFDVYDLTVRSK